MATLRMRCASCNRQTNSNVLSFSSLVFYVSFEGTSFLGFSFKYASEMASQTKTFVAKDKLDIAEAMSCARKMQEVCLDFWNNS